VDEIQSAVDRGLVVLAHATQLEDSSTQFAGYAIVDMETGSGIFRMSSSPAGTHGGEPVRCIASHQPPTSVTYNLTRAWQGAVDSDAGKWMMDRLEDNSPSTHNALSLLNGLVSSFNTRMNNYNAAYATLGETAKPVAGLVMLFTALDLVQKMFSLPEPIGEGVGQIFSLAQKVAWQGVIHTITYLIRLESMSAGIEIPNDCLRLIEF
jgi:hypothetical protein